MYANDFDGEIMLTSIDQLEDFLKKRPIFNSNNFTFYFEKDGFPVLTAFVNDNLSVISYFEGEKESAISLSRKAGRNGSEIFYEDKFGAKISMMYENIVSNNEWVAAAKEFYLTKARPTCICWMEL